MTRLKRNFFIAILLLAALMSRPSVAGSSGETSKPKEGSPVDIKSDRMISYNTKDMVSFIGNVVAVKDGMTTYADNMDVYTEEPSHKINKIVSTGMVKIIIIDQNDSNKKWVGRGDTSIYEKEKDRLTIVGNASVTDAKNVIKGDRIIYNIKDKSMVSYGNEEIRAEIILFQKENE